MSHRSTQTPQSHHHSITKIEPYHPPLYSFCAPLILGLIHLAWVI